MELHSLNSRNSFKNHSVQGIFTNEIFTNEENDRINLQIQTHRCINPPANSEAATGDAL